MASEITRCTSAGEAVGAGGAGFAGGGSSAAEVASGGQGTGRGAEDPLSCSSTWPKADHFPFPRQLPPRDRTLLPLTKNSPQELGLKSTQRARLQPGPAELLRTGLTATNTLLQRLSPPRGTDSLLLPSSPSTWTLPARSSPSSLLQSHAIYFGNRSDITTCLGKGCPEDTPTPFPPAANQQTRILSPCTNPPFFGGARPRSCSLQRADL